MTGRPCNRRRLFPSHGLTFRKQFETLLLNPLAAIKAYAP